MRTLRSIRPGEHAILIYGSSAEQRRLLTQYIRDGLTRRERIIYVADSDAHALPPELLGFSRNKDTMFLTARELYLRDGTFDPDRVLARWKELCEAALCEGYRGLRVTGEMTWALQRRAGTERLLEYEARASAAIGGLPVTALCQYDRHRFPASCLLSVLDVHPLLVSDAGLFHNRHVITRPPRRVRHLVGQCALSPASSCSLQKHSCMRACMRVFN